MPTFTVAEMTVASFGMPSSTAVARITPASCWTDFSSVLRNASWN
jgi:hypothetical protein